MPPEPHRFAILGCTGYTGRKIARVLVDRGCRPLLAGRDETRLRALARELGVPDLPVLAVDVEEPQSMRRLADSCRVCVSAAGPFVRMGPPILDACLAAKTHLFDLTGEPAWVATVQERDGQAKEQQVTIAPSFAFESALADFGAALAMDKLEATGNIRVTYFIDAFPSSTGTKRSVIGVLASPPDPRRAPPFRVSRGRWPWSAEAPRARSTLWRVSYPGAEVPTIVWHAKTTDVAAQFALPPTLGVVLKIVLRPAMFALRCGGGTLAKPFLGARRSGPKEAALARSCFTLAVSAQGRKNGKTVRRTTFVEGRDPYGLTAEIVALGAMEVSDPAHRRFGVLSPSQVVDAKASLDSLKRAGIRWQIEEKEL